MPKRVKKVKKEDLKEEFRKMLIASIMKDDKKKKVKECTTCLKVSSRKSTSSCKPISIKKRVSTKKVKRNKINIKKSKAMFGGDERSEIDSKYSKAMF